MAYPLYKEMADFSSVGIVALFESVVTAVPPFFPVTLFLVWIFGSAGSYFAIFKSTGKHRFFQSLTAFAFISFLASLLIASMNTATTTFLSGYWVGFYILMILASYYLLSNYK